MKRESDLAKLYRPHRSPFVPALLGILALLLCVREVAAAPDDGWDARFFENGANGAVRAITTDGTNVYVGGDFTQIFGVPARRLAKWDGSTWSEVGGGIPTAQYVSALAVIGSDLYVGGNFQQAGTMNIDNIARWNGSVWSKLGTGVSGGSNQDVVAMAVIGTDLYVGGRITTAGGITVNNIAKWNGSSWSALGTGTNSMVRSIAVSGSDVYAGGAFSTAGGVTAFRVAKWDGAAWSALGAGVSGGFTVDVHAVATSGSDVYVGGQFTNAGAVAAANVARWNGSTWSALGSGINGLVTSLAASGADVYAGGAFTTAGGLAASNIAHWNGGTWSAMGGGTEQTNVSRLLALMVVGSDVYAGGLFSRISGVGAVDVARYDGTAWSAPTVVAGQAVSTSAITNIGAATSVEAFATSGGDVYAAGTFHSAGAVAATHVARWNGTGWAALAAPGAEPGANGTAFAIAVNGASVYAAGAFSTINGVSALNIARWNGSTWSALGSGLNGTAFALAVSGTDLYVGGSFTTAGGAPASNVARWNGSSWSALGTGTNGTVGSLAVIGSDVYAAGTFTTAGGVTVNNIARWNGSSWSALGTGTNASVFALAVMGTDLYAAGPFSSAGGTPVGSVARWNGSSWSALGTNLGLICNFCTVGITELAVSGTDLYAGGNFDSIGGVAAKSVARWNGAAWSPLGSGIPIVGAFGSFAVHGMAIAGTDLYVGGYFATAGAKSSSRIAVWHTCGNGIVEGGEQCDDGGTANGDCCSAGCQYELGGGGCADDGNACTNDQCDGSGGCVHPPNTAPCDDGLYCNGTDGCSAGACSQHTGNSCGGADGDVDCAESCDEATDSCTGADPNGSACNDGVFCNGADSCAGGLCVGHQGSPCPAPGGDANCAQSCDEASSSCTAPDPNGAPCDDGVFCNGADTCTAGVCDGHPGDPCTGGAECANACNEATDNCFVAAGAPCTSDANVCTDDLCTGTGACGHPNNTAPCDDGLFCNGADVCGGGICTHGADPCATGLECAHVCNETADNCFDPVGTTCSSDGNPCTVDQCSGTGTCAHAPGNAGTVCRPANGVCDLADSCDGVNSACPADAPQPNGTTCDDADACTTGDACAAGICTGTTTTVCDPCETCDPEGGCMLPTAPGCQTALPQKSSVAFKSGLDPKKHLVKWKWTSSAAVPLGDFGSPLTTSDYTLCVIQNVAGTPTLRHSLTAPAGGSCDGKPCWSAKPTGYQYKDKLATPDGLTKIKLKSGTAAGKAKLSVQGKGALLDFASVQFGTPLIVRLLRSDDAACWEARYSSPKLSKAEAFKSKSD